MKVIQELLIDINNKAMNTNPVEIRSYIERRVEVRLQQENYERIPCASCRELYRYDDIVPDVPDIPTYRNYIAIGGSNYWHEVCYQNHLASAPVRVQTHRLPAN